MENSGLDLASASLLESLCWRLGPRVVVWRDGGTFKRWGLARVLTLWASPSEQINVVLVGCRLVPVKVSCYKK